jgi:hypothetical protein
MNNIGKFLFLHFEKGLVGLLFLGFAYSLIWYGPWRGGSDYDEKLQAIADDMGKKTPVSPPGAVDDLYAKLTQAGELAKTQEPLPDSLLWPLNKIDTPKILPPTDVACIPDRGYIAVRWAINPNQPDMGDAVQFVGVQVDRAVLTSDGPGPFGVLTKAADGPEFMTPTQLYDNVQTVMSVTLEKETKQVAATSTAADATMEAPYSVTDLFNAWHDGVITSTKLKSLVQQGLREGYYTQMDRMFMNDVFQSLDDARREAMRAIRENRQVRGSTSRNISADELFKTSLELLGFTGGGKYVEKTTMPERIAAAATAAAQPATESEKPKPAERPAVMWGEIAIFADTLVNPEIEYRYRVRFWAVDNSGTAGKLISTDWSQETGKMSPKPDTEFYLTGILPDQGRASVLVRKWMYASNDWETRTYYVGPGEQIGKAEVLPKKDTRGNTITDAANKPVMKTVDFSTGCVMLSARTRPKSVETRRTTAEATPTGEIKSVDNIDYVLYDTPQIVYADRKGSLRVKWKSPPEES